ncbi:MAG TPA: 2Fe-2S iron-sulfur cluster-binding protein [Candidatus Tectomicrobia bacterium]|nr:2Fe-2S iron-sulfur cluster-binding protein [Candidatus Tectomicrobia bacterium]
MAPHRVTFLPRGVTVVVEEPARLRAARGRPGSLLAVALAHEFPLPHQCGGACACTTCHVIVRAGAENLSAMEAEEEDRLDMASGLTPTSRLACQAVVRGDVVVEVPA